jgi:hypothetical protein
MNRFAVNKSFSSHTEDDIVNQNSEKSEKVIERIKQYKLFKTYRKLEGISGVFSILTIGTLIIDYENSNNADSLRDSCSLSKSKSENYRILSAFASFCSIVLLFFRYKVKSEWLQKVHFSCPRYSKDILNKFNRRSHIIIEAIIMLIIPIPYFDIIIKVPQHFQGENISLCYKLSTILFMLSMFRVFYIIRVLTNYSLFHSEQSYLNCMQNKVTPGFSFTIQALIKTHPYQMIGIFAFFTVLMGSVLARILERPIDVHINVFYDYIINYYWFTFQTITTIGYGEYTCVTYGCRTVAVLTWFFGSIFVGFLINSLQLTTELTEKEVKSFSLIRKDKQAAKLLTSLLKFNKTKKNSQDKKSFEKAKLGLHLAAEKFRELRLKVKTDFGKYNEIKTELFLIKLTTKSSLKKLDELIKMHS